MKRFTAFVVGVLLSVVAAESAWSQGTPASAAPGSGGIAFVDMRRLFQEYWRFDQVQQQLVDRREALTAQFRKEKVAIEQLMEKSNTLNTDSQEFQELADEIETRRYMLKYRQDTAVKRLERDAAKQETMLYRAVFRECQAYGESRGLAAVLQYRTLDEMLPQDAAGDIDTVVGLRPVVWRDDRADVTSAILANLNADAPPPQPKEQPANDGAGGGDDAGK